MHSPSSPSSADRVLSMVLAGAAVLAASLVLWILVFLLRESLPALRSVGLLRFFSDPAWRPTSGAFDLVPMLAGTLATTAGAVLLAAPLGIASALFTCFYAPPRLARGYGHLLALLAGIPSVVYGLWGLTAVAPRIARLGGSGQCLLTAILVLALMILPTVALTASAALRGVPPELLRGAHALGLGTWSTARRVALPAARAGISTGLLLAVARALGETMAVLMVAGNVVQLPSGLLDSVRTLAANLALEMGYATAGHRSALFVGGLLLLVAVMLLVGSIAWGEGRRHAAR